jgi:MerR family transcriptional regulator, mercuric resistance operon regulatory protein
VSALRTGQVARAAGVNRQTLRYYERRGLLAEPGRSLGGHRLYPDEAVTLLRVIKAAQRLGFSLDEVAGLLQARGARQVSQPSQARSGLRPGAAAAGPADPLGPLAAAKLAEVEAKIASLQEVADTLRAVLRTGCADLIDCAAQPHCPVPFTALPAPAA